MTATTETRAHYNVYSNELDEGCIVFNCRSQEQARDEALNQVLGERLDNLYDGDANSHPDYDPESDLEVSVICDDRLVKAIEMRDI